MTPQELTDFQTAQLAELDKQMAVWDQRLQTLDQQLGSLNQTILDSVQQLKVHLTNLIVSADEWIASAAVDPSIPPELKARVCSLREQVVKLGQLSDTTDPSVIQDLAVLLQAISEELLQNLTSQATTFSTSLNQASSELATHYGIQI